MLMGHVQVDVLPLGESCLGLEWVTFKLSFCSVVSLKNLIRDSAMYVKVMARTVIHDT